MVAWLLWANANPPPRRPIWDPRLLWAGLGLVGLILLGALVIVLLDRWRKRGEPPPLTANEQLAQFRELYERGELSQEEFDRIRARLTPHLRSELGGQPPPASGPLPPGPPSG